MINFYESAVTKAAFSEDDALASGRPLPAFDCPEADGLSKLQSLWRPRALKDHALTLKRLLL